MLALPPVYRRACCLASVTDRARFCAVHLVELRVTNFRAFPAAGISLEDAGMTLLVGANNSGKSALLSAIDILAATEQRGPSPHYGTTSRAVIRGTFSLSENERETLVRRLGPHLSRKVLSNWLASRALTRIEWGFDLLRSETGFVPFSLRVSGGNGEMIPAGELRSADRSDQNTFRSDQNTFPRLDAWVEQGDPTAAISFALRGTARDSYLTASDWPISPLSELLAAWRNEVYHFSPWRRAQAQAVQQASPRLASDGRNLPQALQDLVSNREAKWDRLRRVIADLVPEVGVLRLPATQAEEGQRSQVSVQFEDASGFQRNLEELGTGVAQLLMTAVVGVAQPAGSLIVLEEPETHLHPGAQRRLLEYLVEWSTDRQIVASTHSIVFLDRAVNAVTAIWLVERDAGISTAQRVGLDTVPNVVRALGVRLGDYLAADGILFVEGESDREILDVWFGERLRKHNVVIRDTGGGDSAWKMHDFEDWLSLSNVLTPTTLFIRDRDELDATSIAALEKGRVRVLKRREIENYLLDSPALARLLRERAIPEGKDASVWMPERVEEAFHEIAASLKDRVVAKHVIEQLRAVRPISRKDVRELEDAGLTRDALLAVVRANFGRAESVIALWDNIGREIEARWQAESLMLAPGEELLRGLFARAGLAFDKLRDGVVLARVIHAPSDILDLVEAFLAEVRHAAPGRPAAADNSLWT